MLPENVSHILAWSYSENDDKVIDKQTYPCHEVVLQHQGKDILGRPNVIQERVVRFQEIEEVPVEERPERYIEFLSLINRVLSDYAGQRIVGMTVLHIKVSIYHHCVVHEQHSRQNGFSQGMSYSFAVPGCLSRGEPLGQLEPEVVPDRQPVPL